MASTILNQKEYLKKYLSGADGAKKKKKKKKKARADAKKGLLILDADAGDWQNIPIGGDEDDEAPIVAAITYDCEATRKEDEYRIRSDKWKSTVQDNKTNRSVSGGPGVSGTGESTKIKNNSDSIIQDLKKKKFMEDSIPPRRKINDSNGSCRRKSRFDSPPRKPRHDSDSDDSPPRKQRHDSDDSPPRKQRHDSDESPSRKRHDSDESPPRKRHDSDESPPRKQRHDSDESPPRKVVSDSSKLQNRNHTKRKRYDSDSSPPRRKKVAAGQSSQKNTKSDSDESPPRRPRLDSDESPPRRPRLDSDESPPRRKSEHQDKRVTSVPDRPEKKMTTQEYLIARKRGKLRKDTPEEAARKEREGVLQAEAEAKHKHWNKGLAQLQKTEERIADMRHEMGKSFARTSQDEDLNNMYKSKIREEDPLLKYIASKKTKKDAGPTKPVYQGPFPPNRLNLRPGYRWDGVDRSNGFEQDCFKKQTNKMANEEDGYKYSTEDM